ncbi:MAG: hypothetical protein Q9227_001448 [Pyrenula ochraceoflavens]
MSEPTRISVLISGSGTNLQAVIDAIKASQLPAKIVSVVSNRKEAYGLVRAREAGITTRYHNLVKYKKRHPDTAQGVQAAREEYDQDLAKLVLGDNPDLVACLGFLHIVSKSFLEPLGAAGVLIINLHPALPGKFNGTNALQRAHTDWKEGKIDKTGVMVHKVIAEVDMGTPILVREIPFKKDEDDNLQDFETRVHQIEWGVVVEGIRLVIASLE